MPKPYEVIQNYYPSPMYNSKIGEVATHLQQATPGWRIMNNNPKPTTPQAVFNKLVAWLGQNATWNGSAPGGSGYKLLDGDVVLGQCQLFASAFLMLLTSPPPFGLGIGKTLATTDQWRGKYGKGFVVQHPAQGVLNLAANVPAGNLYFWDDHKVIKHAGQLWDPAYGVRYNSSADVILFQVMPNEVKVGIATYYPCEPTPLAFGRFQVDGEDLVPGQGVFFKEENGVYSGPLARMP